MNYDFCKIISNFKLKGELVSCERYGEGHINETYLAVLENKGVQTKYIVQKINKNPFKDVDKLMNNIRLVTEHARKKIAERGGNPDREKALKYVKAFDYDKHAEKLRAFIGKGPTR